MSTLSSNTLQTLSAEQIMQRILQDKQDEAIVLVSRLNQLGRSGDRRAQIYFGSLLQASDPSFAYWHSKALSIYESERRRMVDIQSENDEKIAQLQQEIATYETELQRLRMIEAVLDYDAKRASAINLDDYAQRIARLQNEVNAERAKVQEKAQSIQQRIVP